MNTALKAISVAVLQTPHDQDVHQFHSLVLFAMRDYCKSAAVAHAVLEEGPGWTWDALQTCYASPEIYTEQLRQLEHFVGEHPSNANVRFLLGYHYLMLNHGEAAERQLGQAVELESKDKLAANILNGLKSDATAKKEPAKTEPTKNRHRRKIEPTKTNTVPSKIEGRRAHEGGLRNDRAGKGGDCEVRHCEVGHCEIRPHENRARDVRDRRADSDDDTTDSTLSTTRPVNEQLAVAVDAVPLSGTWKASPAKGVQIELTLRADKTFTWKFTTNGKSAELLREIRTRRQVAGSDPRRRRVDGRLVRAPRKRRIQIPHEGCRSGRSGPQLLAVALQTHQQDAAFCTTTRFAGRIAAARRTFFASK